MSRIRVAFIKFGGLSAGGTERWLQMMAAALPRDRFDVTYFFTDTAPYIGADYQHPGTDVARREFLRLREVKLVEVRVGAKDVTVPTHDWRDTNFWDLFDPGQFDIVQCAKAGPPEYPFYRIDLPIVEYPHVEQRRRPGPEYRIQHSSVRVAAIALDRKRRQGRDELGLADSRRGAGVTR